MAVKTVRINGPAFPERPTTIRPGDAVRFENATTDSYYILFDDYENPVELDPGDAATKEFRVPGKFAYRCTLHEGMAGSVVVLDPASPPVQD